MTSPRRMILILAGLILAAVASPAIRRTGAAPGNPIAWNAFLIGLPIVLIGFLWAEARWALMAGVMYGTIGLSLDISTLVQDLTGPETEGAAFRWLTGMTGLFNFLLIVIGGRGFLDVVSSSTPRAGRPPNPPPRSSC